MWIGGRYKTLIVCRRTENKPQMLSAESAKGGQVLNADSFMAIIAK
jgi:hypothetical protein